MSQHENMRLGFVRLGDMDGPMERTLVAFDLEEQRMAGRAGARSTATTPARPMW